jgi:hypothetical protein
MTLMTLMPGLLTVKGVQTRFGGMDLYRHILVPTGPVPSGSPDPYAKFSRPVIRD